MKTTPLAGITRTDLETAGDVPQSATEMASIRIREELQDREQMGRDRDTYSWWEDRPLPGIE